MTSGLGHGTYRNMSDIDVAVARVAKETTGYQEAFDVIEVLQQAALDSGGDSTEHGPAALFAGGCVRDWASGKTPKDLDIATAMGPDDVVRALRRALKGCSTQLVGKHFGVVRVRPERDGQWYEVATFREEGPYTDHRHPSTVTWTTREKDAQRRDFTVNGLYFDPVSSRVFDDVGGLEDLSTSTLRAIGDPQRRFEEDALRLIRAIRFATRENYSIEPLTLEAMRRHAGLLDTVSPERIREEFIKIASLGGDRMARAFADIVATGLLAVVWKLMHPDGMQCPDERSISEIGHRLSSMNNLPEGPLRLSPFIAAWHVDLVTSSDSYSSWKSVIQEAAKRLRFSADEADLMIASLHAIWRSRGGSEVDAFRARRCAAHPQVAWHLSFARACAVPIRDAALVEAALFEIAKGWRIKPILNGGDLMALGATEGPMLGRLTKWLLAKQFRGDICDETSARHAVSERITRLRMP